MDRQRAQWSFGVPVGRRYKRLRTTPCSLNFAEASSITLTQTALSVSAAESSTWPRNGLQPPQRILSSVCLRWSRAAFTAMGRSARVIQVTAQQFCG
jgi:hypothetical protein